VPHLGGQQNGCRAPRTYPRSTPLSSAGTSQTRPPMNINGQLSCSSTAWLLLTTHVPPVNDVAATHRPRTPIPNLAPVVDSPH